jgi:hypothetical protein
VADVAPEFVTPHNASAECGDMHCYYHGLDEDPEGAFRVCGECFHVYRTAEALREAWGAEVSEAVPESGPVTPPPAEKILACVYCCHDW